VVFLSDGVPDPAVDDATLRAGVQTIAGLRPGQVSFNTIYYGEADPVANARLKNMAAAGAGQFKDASISTNGQQFVISDVINVAGHRLGTREIEESISSHAAVAEVAVVGVADQLKGQVAMAFAVLEDAGAVADPAARLKLEGEVMKTVDGQLGAVARPARIHFVTLLPKTRSGKMLRRAIQAVCEQRDPGDLTTMDDPTALQQIRELVAAK